MYPFQHIIRIFAELAKSINILVNLTIVTIATCPFHFNWSPFNIRIIAVTTKSSQCAMSLQSFHFEQFRNSFNKSKINFIRSSFRVHLDLNEIGSLQTLIFTNITLLLVFYSIMLGIFSQIKRRQRVIFLLCSPLLYPFVFISFILYWKYCPFYDLCHVIAIGKRLPHITLLFAVYSEFSCQNILWHCHKNVKDTMAHIFILLPVH